jgi:predicted MFS family arabinose efflux permease
MPLVASLGIAQIVSWGTLFYAIGVLGPAMRADLGASELFLFGSFTAGLLVSGTLAPIAGRLIDARGGRFVLSLGSGAGFIAMAILAVAPNPAVMAAGWLVAGAAMSSCLYDPAFATLSQHAGSRYRSAVTALTLFGGFASTVFWPVSHLLLQAWGWREAFGIYAALHLCVCLPIHLRVPRHAQIPHPDGLDTPRPASHSSAFSDPRLRWLTASFALVAFIVGVVAIHMIELLTSAGLTAAQAVTVAMLVGPMQVAGRIVVFAFAGRVRVTRLGVTAFTLILLSLVALISVNGFGAAAILFVTVYGAGNGVLTIVRGTTPAELFGRDGLGSVLGHLSRAGLYSTAIAPAAYSMLLTLGLTRTSAVTTLMAVALGAMGSYAIAVRSAPATRAA